MKITVEFDDFWMNGDDDLSEKLNEYVSDEVTREIWKKIEQKVESQITVQVTKKIEAQLFRKGQSIVKKLIETEKIKSPSHSVGENGYCTLEEFIKYNFESNSGWNSPNETIKKLAKGFASEMKSRYDLLFASQLVAKMNESGLLKEDVAAKLLS